MIAKDSRKHVENAKVPANRVTMRFSILYNLYILFLDLEKGLSCHLERRNCSNKNCLRTWWLKVDIILTNMRKCDVGGNRYGYCSRIKYVCGVG